MKNLQSLWTCLKDNNHKGLPRVALLGGAFNPVHIGHLHIANVVIGSSGYDKVMFIPAYFPPHKSNYNLASAYHRLSMLKLATRGRKEFLVSDIEIKRGGMSYTVETVRDLRLARAFATPFGLVVGDDLVDDLHLWKDFNILFNEVKLLVAQRKSCRVEVKVPHIYLDNHLINLSSSELRERILRNQVIESLVPDEVVDYIHKNKLYGDIKK